MLRHALIYAGKGFYVFPLVEKKKNPATQNGFYQATTNQQQINNWWTASPNQNIGIRCGRGFKILCLDVDRKKDVNGFLWLDAQGDLPSTVEQTTPSGGKQFLFAMPDEDLKSTAGKIAPGIDVRADGGYFVAAPSFLAKIDGYQYEGNYEWTSEQGIGEIELAAAPEWLLAAIRATRRPKQPLEIPDVIKDGSRNETLFKVACKARNVGMSRDEILAVIKVANRSRCAHPLPESELAGIADRAAGYEKGVGEMATAPEQNKKKGQTPPRTLGNALHYLNSIAELKGLFQYNEFSRDLELTRNPPFKRCERSVPIQIEDEDLVQLRAFFAERKIELSKEIISDAVINTALAKSYHPVKNYLAGLQWDGVKRLDDWLVKYGGAQDTLAHRAIGKIFLIAAVERIDKPGCKFDTMVILEGDQGIGKSEAIRALAGEWFSEISLAETDKETVGVMRGKWIIEVPEMTVFNQKEIEALKAFLSTPIDRMRVPYGRFAKNFPRQSVFIGTINPTGSGYLKDITGNRRFLPVKVEQFDVGAIRRDRDQLFAEAWAAYQNGAKSYLEHDAEVMKEVRALQKEREVVDPLEESVSAYLDSPGITDVSVLEIWDNWHTGFSVPVPGNEARRIVKILVGLGYEKIRPTINGKRSWRWALPEKRQKMQKNDDFGQGWT